ncbi:hypothetical protein P154DRAFT_163880 [Amniculicola lignicola CBS 123094]|uniref:Uncharacterized protein n=1 Tax=Amniculicola lignicola CBS 123094 TaxID=1392246 RepID=A0A6A5WII4_9PLEO|nr:hypothetical protein P154DRAFT_163880 [Amniculicola lignicola CBS 123094]
MYGGALLVLYAAHGPPPSPPPQQPHLQRETSLDTPTSTHSRSPSAVPAIALSRQSVRAALGDDRGAPESARRVTAPRAACSGHCGRSLCWSLLPCSRGSFRATAAAERQAVVDGLNNLI